MNGNRLWAVGTAVLVLILLAGTFFLGVSPQLSATDTATASLTAVQAQNAAEEVTLKGLKKDYEDIEDLRDELEELRLSVPDGRDESSLVGNLNVWAANRGFFIESIEFDTPVAWVPTETTDQELLNAMGQVGEGRFYALTVRIQGTAETPGQLMSFLDDVQHGDRLVLVNEFSVSAVEEANQELGGRLNIIGQIFVLTGEGSAVVPDSSTVQ